MRPLLQRNLTAQKADETDIGHTDDFICQERTHWSGLGVIALLAGILDIPDAERQALRGWYERHVSFYKIVKANPNVLEGLNVVNDELYRVRIDMERSPFKPNQIVFGSLLPWHGEWYWSDRQQVWDDDRAIDITEIKKTMIRKSSQVVCRFWKEYEVKVRVQAVVH